MGNFFIDCINTVPYFFSLYASFFLTFVNQMFFLPTAFESDSYSMRHQGQISGSRCSMMKIGISFLRFIDFRLIVL